MRRTAFLALLASAVKPRVYKYTIPVQTIKEKRTKSLRFRPKPHKITDMEKQSVFDELTGILLYNLSQNSLFFANRSWRRKI